MMSYTDRHNQLHILYSFAMYVYRAKKHECDRTVYLFMMTHLANYATCIIIQNVTSMIFSVVSCPDPTPHAGKESGVLQVIFGGYMI